MLRSMMAVAFGASCGALLRWGFTLLLNTWWTLPLGTLCANLLGCYFIGVAASLFASLPSIASEWRLLVNTGFLGGLTTFSTFSLEVVQFLQQGRLGWGLAVVGLHLLGSLLMTFLGMMTVFWFR